MSPANLDIARNAVTHPVNDFLINSVITVRYIELKLSIIYPTIANASRVMRAGVRNAVRPIHWT